MIGTKRLVNLEKDTTVLDELEINLLSAVICATLNHLKTGTMVGTFILYGQKEGASANLILRFDLPHGSAQKQRWLPHRIDFAEKAELAIDYFLSESAYRQVETSVHRDGNHWALVVNTTYGRFLATFYADFPEKSDNCTEFVLCVVADVLARFTNDAFVAQAARRLLFHTQWPDQIGGFTNKLFRERSLPEIVFWYYWQNSALMHYKDPFS